MVEFPGSGQNSLESDKGGVARPRKGWYRQRRAPGPDVHKELLDGPARGASTRALTGTNRTLPFEVPAIWNWARTGRPAKRA